MYVLPTWSPYHHAPSRRSGADTLELLLTSPAGGVDRAKFCSPGGRLLAGSGAYAVILGLYGEPDWAPIYGGYLALLLLGCLLVALGVLTSSLTENQVVAATCALGLFLMLWFADSASYMLPAPLDVVAINLSLIGHFTTFVSGSLFPPTRLPPLASPRPSWRPEGDGP
jgi:ABC-2 type transport system permease protein